MFEFLFKNGKKILTREQSDILSASAGMMVIIILTKIVGMITKTIAVSQLGAEKYGLFIAANTLPETISMILIFGSITSVLIPILVDEIEKSGIKSFSKLFSSIVNSSLLALSLVTFFIVLLSDRAIPIIIEKVADPIEPFTSYQITQIASMMRWLMLTQVILGVSTFLSSALNSFRRFLVPQLAPFFYNIGILIGALFIIPFTGGSPWGLTYGVFIGSILHLLIQIPLTSHLKIKYEFIIDITSKKLRNIIFVGLPRIITLAADQIAIFIDRIIAIGLGAAPLGAYYLAVSLVTIPYSLFSSTFSIASLPHLSCEYSKGNVEKFKVIFSKVFNQILFLSLPLTTTLLVLRLPLVRLLYGILGKEFTWENTLMVSWVVFFLSLGLVPEILAAFLNRAFYAMCDTIRPLIIGIFVVIGGIFTGVYFTNYFSHFDTFSLRELSWDFSFFPDKSEGLAAIGGLALSSSLIYTISFFMLIVLFRMKVGSLSKYKFLKSIVRKFICGISMAVIMYVLFKMWDGVLDTARTINVFILTFSTIIPGLTVYLWLLYIFKDQDMDILARLLISVQRLIFPNKKLAE